MAIIEKGIGRHFDPDVAEAFLNAADRFNDVARKYLESD